MIINNLLSISLLLLYLHSLIYTITFVNNRKNKALNNKTNLPKVSKSWGDRFKSVTGILFSCATILGTGFSIGYTYCGNKKESDFKIKLLELEFDYQLKLKDVEDKYKSKGLQPLTDEEYKFFYDNYIKNKNEKK